MATFDELPGGTPEYDLLIAAHGDAGPVTIGLEARSGDTFGGTVAQYETRARRHADGEPSAELERLAGPIEDCTGVG